MKTISSNAQRQLSELATRLGKFFINKPLSFILWFIALLVVLQVVRMAVWANDYSQWVGFGAYDEEQLGARAKTLWDWMDLLLVPGTLAAGAFLLNRWQKQNEIELENDRQRQAMLEAYYDKMSELLLEYKLRENKSAEARSIARTWTLALFRVLDGDRKGEALQFLYESGLIFNDPIIKLTGADLHGAELSGATLIEADLSGTDLSAGSLANAQLIDANLGGIVLNKADLQSAALSGANLDMAILERADLRGAKLDGTYLYGSNLRGALCSREQFAEAESLQHATMPDGRKYERWQAVD